MDYLKKGVTEYEIEEVKRMVYNKQVNMNEAEYSKYNMSDSTQKA